jgi:hypothetical protein
MSIENIIKDSATIMTLVGVYAFFISIVVQLTKEFVPKVIPTKLYVLVISIITTVTGTLCYCSYNGYDIKYYTVIGSIVLGFIVAFVTMYGWDELKSIKDRFIRK